MGIAVCNTYRPPHMSTAVCAAHNMTTPLTFMRTYMHALNTTTTLLCMLLPVGPCIKNNTSIPHLKLQGRAASMQYSESMCAKH